VRILLWHVHGSWTTSFVQGSHEYVLPVEPNRGPDGRGRARTWDWPPAAVEVPLDALADVHVDAVVLQRPSELRLCRERLGRWPGRDVPAVYVEHNTPGAGAVTTPHPLAEQSDIPIVHVTHFNRLIWDNGRSPTTVIEHGIVDPGTSYTGEHARAAVVVNEPVRRGRTVGADLLASLTDHIPTDVFGMQVDALQGDGDRLRTFEDLGQRALHEALGRRRVYAHLHRWTSLGLSLLEAMHLGMPVVVLATTEAASVIPAAAGCVSNRPGDLYQAARDLCADRSRAQAAGVIAREVAVGRWGLQRFLDDWDSVLSEVVGGGRLT
jgi:hypothetical protein